ncbi:hypothetical protein CROQUDRAFT_92750 [Cronartium quercuum f. sp. fusiforme G11]|uniref:Uncharacterized protein n=1 Tax=Cronartium quercuum f. sp. fusiforme G11 TaxID=708437 RepID=A0A9P6NI77_9BASI|nr:hypothetical protein CROQUDRAFT_92750 [Cronartium quercuum f. sp. fusiforme G11]
MYTTGAIVPAQDGRLPVTSGHRPIMAGGPSPKGHKGGPCEDGRPHSSSYRPQIDWGSIWLAHGHSGLYRGQLGRASKA